MSKLLFDEAPLVIQPQFAMLVGLNESIVIQQLHYWLQKSDNFRDGRKWVYNTYKDWQDQFPFWSEKTIKRTVSKLENDSYILTANYNRAAFDKTKWYSLNYDKLYVLFDRDKMTRREGQNDPMEGDKLSPPIPETTQRLTTENLDIPFSNIIDYLNKKTNQSYKATTKKTQQCIKARFNEGFTVADFKMVIDKKATEWLNDPKMAAYLRPETLFGPKFESYLNQHIAVPMKESIQQQNNYDDQPKEDPMAYFKEQARRRYENGSQPNASIG